MIGNDELGDESGDGEQPKADGQDNFGFYEIRKIGAFECNGAGSCTHLELNRANRSTMTCADGTSGATCEARTLDLSDMTLSAKTSDKVLAALQASASDPSVGTQVLARGEFVHGTNPLQPGVDWVTFKPTELWVAQIHAGSTDGTFVRITDNGRRCITAPCATTHEGRINSVKDMETHGLDWSDDAASSDVRDAVANAMYTPDGAIVVGYRTHGTMAGQQTTLRSVNQVYLPVTE